MKKWIKILIASVSIILVALLTWHLVYIYTDYLPNKEAKEEALAEYNKQYAERLELFATENDMYDDYEVEVAFLGDSLTHGCDVNHYYSEYTVVNRGIGGDTTTTLLNRMQVSVYDLKPQVVVLLIGGNNLFTMFDDYEDILVGLSTNLPDTKVILVSLSAMSGEWAENNRNEQAIINNQTIKCLANKYSYTYVDIFTDLYDVTTKEAYEDVTVDGAHFTDKGYQIVSRNIKVALNELLTK